MVRHIQKSSTVQYFIHNPIQSVGQFRGSRAYSEIRMVPVAQTNPHTVRICVLSMLSVLLGL